MLFSSFPPHHEKFYCYSTVTCTLRSHSAIGVTFLTASNHDQGFTLWIYSALHKAQGFTASGPYLPFRISMHAQSVKPQDAKSQCRRHRSHTPFTVCKEATGLHAPLWCVKARGFLPYPNPIGCISHMISLGNNHGIQYRETRFHFAIFFGLFHLCKQQNFFMASF